MATGIVPTVGNWYQSADQLKFEVVAIDEDEAVIEIQYFDGELDEVDFDSWPQIGVEGISAPEDWTGPYGEFERDDLGYTDLNIPPEGYTMSFDEWERDK